MKTGPAIAAMLLAFCLGWILHNPEVPPSGKEEQPSYGSLRVGDLQLVCGRLRLAIPDQPGALTGCDEAAERIIDQITRGAIAENDALIP